MQDRLRFMVPMRAVLTSGLPVWVVFIDIVACSVIGSGPVHLVADRAGMSRHLVMAESAAQSRHAMLNIFRGERTRANDP